MLMSNWRLAATWVFGILSAICAPAAAALAVDDDDVRLEELEISALRTPRLVRDEPLRVEAVPAEEIEENGTVNPGALTSLLEELAGVQFQSAAPGLGGAGLRLRGLPARLTQVRVDGLPLLGPAPEGFGLLQSPPLDLGRVEVIKGAASALYGSGAIGGVLNLVSLPRGAESALLANATNHDAQDLVAFLSEEKPQRLAGSVLVGLHHQERGDRDHDGWAEIPAYRRAVLRPRLSWSIAGEEWFMTAGFVREHRQGGTTTGSALPLFPLVLETEREDLGLRGQGQVTESVTWHATLAWARSAMAHRAGTAQSSSTQALLSGEYWLAGITGRHDWLLGLAAQSQDFAVAGRPELGRRDAAPALFVQDEWALSSQWRASANVRFDAYRDAGRLPSARASLLWRPSPEGAWSLRASSGTGFALPTVFVDEIESLGPGVLSRSARLRVEHGTTSALDLRWARGDFELDIGVFEARLQDRLGLDTSGGQVRVVNQSGVARFPGTEVVGRYVDGPLHVIGSWTRLQPRESDAAGVWRDVERVPRQSAELAVLLERGDVGRLGVEFGYTGSQALRDEPRRDRAAGYLEVSVLAAIRIKSAALFLNLENLTDVRQSRFGVLRSRANPIGGLPAREGWAPLEGRKINAGVRLEL